MMKPASAFGRQYNVNRVLAAIILATATSFIFSCRELYYPDIDPPGNVISVEGLITDGPGPYFVRLSRTSAWTNDTLPEPVNDANLYVTDQNGDLYMYNQVQPGLYRSPSFLQGRVGDTYTLHIQTREGDEYRSSPQTIMPNHGIGDLLADSAYRTRARVTNSGNLVIENINGVNATLVVDRNTQSPGNIRFRTDVKVLFTYEGGSFLQPVRYYCWREIRRFEGLDNINLPLPGNRPGGISNNVVAFMPFDKTEYRLRLSDVLSTLVVKVTLYTINDETYNYFLNINKQLSADETVFAPIPSQIDGNIFSVEDEKRFATGFFEASSVTSRDFILRTPPYQKNIFFEPTYGYDDIPPAGCIADEPPPFWIN